MWRHESTLMIFSLIIIFLWIRINTTTNLSESNYLHLCLHITSIVAIHLFLIY
jgi:low affinity Fe/Cu permease